jgi:hypothetical protein
MKFRSFHALVVQKFPFLARFWPMRVQKVDWLKLFSFFVPQANTNLSPYLHQ